MQLQSQNAQVDVDCSVRVGYDVVFVGDVFEGTSFGPGWVMPSRILQGGPTMSGEWGPPHEPPVYRQNQVGEAHLEVNRRKDAVRRDSRHENIVDPASGLGAECDYGVQEQALLKLAQATNGRRKNNGMTNRRGQRAASDS